MRLVKVQLAFLALAVIGVFGSAVAAAASDPPPIPASSLEPVYFGGDAIAYGGQENHALLAPNPYMLELNAKVYTGTDAVALADPGDASLLPAKNDGGVMNAGPVTIAHDSDDPLGRISF